jgi:putative addiction module killer protein
MQKTQKRICKPPQLHNSKPFFPPLLFMKKKMIATMSLISYNINMQKRQLLIYKTTEGKEPFIDWLESIKETKTRNRILTRLDRLQIGNPGDYKYLDQGISELRLKFGAGYRIYYAEEKGKIIILLCGGDKSTQDKDIKKAINYFKDYKEQNR